MISVLNKIGRGHNTCQDNIFVEEDEDCIWGAVADGCSNGYKAEFASQLFIYTLQKLGKDAIRTHVLMLAAFDVSDIYSKLQMPSIHALSTTVLIFIYIKESKELYIRTLGDGFYKVNDDEYIIDQNNTPDYFGFHILGDLLETRKYLDKNPIKSYENVNSFTIASDGILSYQLSQFKEDEGINPKEFLLQDIDSPKRLELRYNILKKKGWENTDDLSMISYVNDK